MKKEETTTSSSSVDRRDFLKKSLAGTALFTLGGILPGFSTKSYGRIMGANNKVQVGVMGVNSRGMALATNFALQPNFEVMSISDVDSRAAEKCIAAVEKVQNKKPANIPDFRKSLDDKQLDALIIAAPDHWHAPAAILASKAGKHVYLEKPCSHNPHEGELLIAAQQKYKNVIQMGNQRRSWPNVAKAIKEVHDGTIGKAYFAKGWYTNTRQSIGYGKAAPIPSWLDFDLWQGPAPRREFKDNLVHYNWHWFWHWGTAESLNNGTHMLDLMRWALQVEYPTKVSSNGGRFHFKDDQETPDTQVINLDFGDKCSMTWEGRSSNGMPIEGSSVGAQFFGDKGSIQIDGGNSYRVFDIAGKLVKEVKNDLKIDPRNNMNPSQALDAFHFQNFHDAIKNGAPLASDIVGGHQSTLLCQLGNIAYRTGSALDIDSKTGRIKNNKQAQKLWKREYQKGWEPTV